MDKKVIVGAIVVVLGLLFIFSPEFRAGVGFEADLTTRDFTGYNETIIGGQKLLLPRNAPVRLDIHLTVQDATKTDAYFYLKRGNSEILLFDLREAVKFSGDYDVSGRNGWYRVRGCGRVDAPGCRIPRGSDCHGVESYYFNSPVSLRNGEIILKYDQPPYVCGTGMTGVTVDKIVAYQATVCGDGLCEGQENLYTCEYDCDEPVPPPPQCDIPLDCEGRQHVECVGAWQCIGQQCVWMCAICGNEVCDPGETPENCAYDCDYPPGCGDDTCDDNETYLTCPLDCPCPDITAFRIVGDACVTDIGCDYDPHTYTYYDTLAECEADLPDEPVPPPTLLDYIMDFLTRNWLYIIILILVAVTIVLLAERGKNEPEP